MKGSEIPIRAAVRRIGMTGKLRGMDSKAIPRCRLVALPGQGEGFDVGVGVHRFDDTFLVAEAGILDATEG